MVPGPTAPDLNEYIVSLVQGLRRRGVNVEDFKVRKLPAADVLHLHWPEGGLGSPLVVRALLHGLSLLAATSCARALGVPVVWTVHNLAPHEVPHPHVTGAFLRAFSRSVSGAISLSDAGRDLAMGHFAALRDRPHVVIRHGDYSTDYQSPLGREQRPVRRLLAFGDVRPYKRVDLIISAFLAAAEVRDDLQLTVMGRPRGSELSQELERLAGAAERIELLLRRAAKQDVDACFDAADALLMAHENNLNSGVAMLALTLHLPVIAPRHPVLSELAADVGKGWIQLYDPPLSGPVLLSALRGLDEARDDRGSSGPDLRKYGWDEVVDKTRRFYRLLAGG